MGKINFDPFQKLVIEEFTVNEYLTGNFYFTGGTALSYYYLYHRLSEDLDFFCEKPFNLDKVNTFIKSICKKFKLSAKLRQPQDNIAIFSLTDKHNKILKVDFNHYPYRRIEKGKIENGIQIDSLRDIGANKLLTINQRSSIKDFVDLYFLLKEFTLWDLVYAVEVKFHMELEKVMLATDFLKVEDFDYLPKMLVPLTNRELTDFFRKQAIEIGKRITK